MVVVVVYCGNLSGMVHHDGHDNVWFVLCLARVGYC